MFVPLDALTPCALMPRVILGMWIAHCVLASMLGGNWTAGMVLHFVNGTLIFPAIYSYALAGWLPGPPAVKGTIWGVVLWLMAQLVVMPMMGAGVFSSAMGDQARVAVETGQIGYAIVSAVRL